MNDNLFEYITQTAAILEEFDKKIRANVCTTPEDYAKELENLAVTKGSKKYSLKAVDNFRNISFYRKFLTSLVSIAKLPKNHTSITMMHYLVFEITDDTIETFFNFLMTVLKPKERTSVVRLLSNKNSCVTLVKEANKCFDIRYVEDEIINQFEERQKSIKLLRANLRQHHLFEQVKFIRPLTIPIDKKVYYQPKTDLDSCDSMDGSAVCTYSSSETPVYKKIKYRKWHALVLDDLKIRKKYQKEREKNYRKQMQDYTVDELTKFSCANAEKTGHYRKVMNAIERQRKDQNEPEHFGPPDLMYRTPEKPVRETAATILRRGERFKKNVERTKQVVNYMALGGADPYKIGQMFEDIQREKREYEMQEVERKHLSGLLSHEDARLARLAIKAASEFKATEFRRQKEQLDKALQKWKNKEMARMKEIIHETREFNECAKISNGIRLENKRQQVQKEFDEYRRYRLQIEAARRKELETKSKLIRQIINLQQMRKQACALEPKYDRNEMAGLGFFCEMSIADLHSHLNEWRERTKKDLMKRHQEIMEQREERKKLVDDTLDIISKHTNIKKPERVNLNLSSDRNQKLREELLKKRQLIQALNKCTY